MRAVATPGPSWTRLRKDEAWRLATASRSRTVTLAPREDVAASLRVAATTTCSRTGAGASTRSRATGAPTIRATRAGWSRNPGSADLEAILPGGKRPRLVAAARAGHERAGLRPGSGSPRGRAGPRRRSCARRPSRRPESTATSAWTLAGRGRRRRRRRARGRRSPRRTAVRRRAGPGGTVGYGRVRDGKDATRWRIDESPSREEAPSLRSVKAGFLAPGSQLRLRPSPVSRVAVLHAPYGGGLAGYSGGTAQVFDLLPS